VFLLRKEEIFCLSVNDSVDVSEEVALVIPCVAASYDTCIVARPDSIHNFWNDIELDSYFGKDITVSEAVLRRRDKVDACKSRFLSSTK
jgi:hypothetical protein